MVLETELLCLFLLIVKVDKTRQRKCEKCTKMHGIHKKNIDKIVTQVYNNRN